jgi:hypothetical protein
MDERLDRIEQAIERLLEFAQVVAKDSQTFHDAGADMPHNQRCQQQRDLAGKLIAHENELAKSALAEWKG